MLPPAQGGFQEMGVGKQGSFREAEVVLGRGPAGSSPVHYELSSGLKCFPLCSPSISQVLKNTAFFKWKDQPRLVVFPPILALEPL